MGDVDGVCGMARDDVDVLVVVRILVLMFMRMGWGMRRRWRRG